jgi:hypothetical protein
MGSETAPCVGARGLLSFTHEPASDSFLRHHHLLVLFIIVFRNPPSPLMATAHSIPLLTLSEPAATYFCLRHRCFVGGLSLLSYERRIRITLCGPAAFFGLALAATAFDCSVTAASTAASGGVRTARKVP